MDSTASLRPERWRLTHHWTVYATFLIGSLSTFAGPNELSPSWRSAGLISAGSFLALIAFRQLVAYLKVRAIRFTPLTAFNHLVAVSLAYFTVRAATSPDFFVPEQVVEKSWWFFFLIGIVSGALLRHLVLSSLGGVIFFLAIFTIVVLHITAGLYGGNPRWLGLALCGLLAAVISSTSNRSSRMVAAITILGGITMLGGRSTTLVAVLLAIAYLMSHPRITNGTQLILTGATGILSATLITVSGNSSRWIAFLSGENRGANDPKLNLPLTDITLSVNMNGRLELWDRYLADFPIQIFGCGAGCHYVSGGIDSQPRYSRPHNEFLSVLVDYGLVGLALVVILIFFWLSLSFKSRAYFSVTLVVSLVLLASVDNVMSSLPTAIGFGLAIGSVGHRQLSKKEHTLSG